MEELSYVGPYLIGHFTGDSELAVVLLLDPETHSPLVNKEELHAIETCVEKEMAVKFRVAYYDLFEAQNDTTREIYARDVHPLNEVARLARNSDMEAVVHEDLYAGEFRHLRLCHGLVSNTLLAPFMYTYTATDPYIVVKAKSSTIIFKQTKENILASLVSETLRDTNLIHVAHEVDEAQKLAEDQLDGEGKHGGGRVHQFDI